MDFGDILTWYWLMAVVGTAFLGLRMAALLMGLGHEGGADVHGDGAHGAGHAGHAHAGHGHSDASPDHDQSMRLFTTQGLAAFLMGTGWLGVALHGRLPLLAVVGLSASFGAVVLAFLAWMLARVKRLESSGTFHAESCVGQQAKVYLRIPQGGVGQVQVRAQGRFITMNATCDSETIETGRDVVVYDLKDRVLMVAPFEPPT